MKRHDPPQHADGSKAKPPRQMLVEQHNADPHAEYDCGTLYKGAYRGWVVFEYGPNEHAATRTVDD